MKQYRVIVSPDAKADLRSRLDYLLNVKKSPQAFDNVLDDYEQTIEALETSAGILKPCDNPALAARGLHRINFRTHNYFMLYYLDDDKAHVTNIFHEKEDYEGKLT